MGQSRAEGAVDMGSAVIVLMKPYTYDSARAH
jgi:hypothetical protein